MVNRSDAHLDHLVRRFASSAQGGPPSPVKPARAEPKPRHGASPWVVALNVLLVLLSLTAVVFLVLVRG